MRKRQITMNNSSQRGMALAVVMITLLVITTIVAAMIVMSTSETSTSANFRDEQAAFFAARAGIEEVRERMRTSSPSPLIASVPAALPGTPGGVLYVTNPLNGETVAPWNTAAETHPPHYPDDEICNELACVGGAPAGAWYVTPALSASPNYQGTPPLPWKWVRVMNKINRSVTPNAARVTSVNGAADGLRVCWNALTGNEVTVAAGFASCQAASGPAGNLFPVYELTALAVTPSGSRRIIQYEVGPVGFPQMPGALTFDGANPDYSTNPSSAAFRVNGNDSHLGCPGAPTNEPAIAGFDANSASTIAGQLTRPASYVGTGGNPSVVNSNSQLGMLGTVDGLQAMVQAVKVAAGSNIYTSPATPTNIGTTANPVINVVNGDYTLSGGTSGAGILLVTGTLTLNGNPNWNGLILVIGNGHIVKNGGGNGYLDGAIFVANMYTDTSYTTPIALGGNRPPGPPVVSWGGGGNATIQYDACWSTNLNSSFPFKAISDRELIY